MVRRVRQESAVGHLQAGRVSAHLPFHIVDGDGSALCSDGSGQPLPTTDKEWEQVPPAERCVFCSVIADD
jgi:hypothetical protein